MTERFTGEYKQLGTGWYDPEDDEDMVFMGVHPENPKEGTFMVVRSGMMQHRYLPDVFTYSLDWAASHLKRAKRLDLKGVKEERLAQKRYQRDMIGKVVQ